MAEKTKEEKIEEEIASYEALCKQYYDAGNLEMALKTRDSINILQQRLLEMERQQVKPAPQGN